MIFEFEVNVLMTTQPMRTPREFVHIPNQIDSIPMPLQCATEAWIRLANTRREHSCLAGASESVRLQYSELGNTDKVHSIVTCTDSHVREVIVLIIERIREVCWAVEIKES